MQNDSHLASATLASFQDRISAKFIDAVRLVAVLLCSAAFATLVGMIVGTSGAVNGPTAGYLAAAIPCFAIAGYAMLDLTEKGSLGKQHAHLRVCNLAGHQADFALRLRRALIHHGVSLLVVVLLLALPSIDPYGWGQEYVVGCILVLPALNALAALGLILSTGRSQADWLSGTYIGMLDKKDEAVARGFEIIPVASRIQEEKS